MAETLDTRLSALTVRIAQECKSLQGQIGALDSLTTDVKTDLVSAINSLVTKLQDVESGIGDEGEIKELQDALDELKELVTGLINDEEASSDHVYSSNKVEDLITAAEQQVKDDLLGGAGEAYDTLKELADLIKEEQDAIDALKALAAGHVKFDEAQELTEEQKAQARENIGAASAGDLTSVGSAVEAAQGTADEAKSAAEKAQSDVDAVKEVVGDEKVLTFADVIGGMPNYYERVALPVCTFTDVTIYANTQVNINNKGYISTSDTVLSVSDLGDASSRAGKDAYIYACQPADEDSTEPVFVLSFNSTMPDNYTEDSSRKIGGFHCECLALGTLANNKLSGLGTGEIIPNTVWDLNFKSNWKYGNTGQYYSSCGLWFGIYGTSMEGDTPVSVFGGAVITGTTSTAMHGDKFAEVFGANGGKLPSIDEFMVTAKGTPECTNISGSANPVTAGGHVDTNGDRITSEEGGEDWCGVYWWWTHDCDGHFNAIASSTYSASIGQYGGGNASGEYWVQGYGWDKSNNADGTSRNRNDTVDGDNDYGDSYGVKTRASVGGRWGNGSSCGSRCVALRSLSAYCYSSLAGRFAAEPRVAGH